MQNKPYFFFWKQGFPKGGEGGGPTLGEKFPKNPFSFFGQRPLAKLNLIFFQLYSGTSILKAPAHHGRPVDGPPKLSASSHLLDGLQV